MMAEPPAELIGAVRTLKRARARHDAALVVVHDQMRQARKAGATIGQLVDWTGYSRRRVIQLTSRPQT